MPFWYFALTASKALISLGIQAVLPEPSLLTYIESMSTDGGSDLKELLLCDIAVHACLNIHFEHI